MRTYKQLEELLDSDDEFPSTYNESSSIPAYKNDSRFDEIIFKWIYNTNKETECDNKDIDSISDYSKNSNIYEPKLNRGVMKAQDLFCIKSIADSTTRSMLLWLINFMIIKDSQSNYTFLTSCLVPKF